MTASVAVEPLLEAVNRYFALMYESDVATFDQVFAPSAQLHGVHGDAVRVLPASDFKSMLASRPSPKSKNAPRLQEVLLIDFASPTQAVAKVRVRIDTFQYIDYLSYHYIKDSWLITAKSYHVERKFEAAA